MKTAHRAQHQHRRTINLSRCRAAERTAPSPGACLTCLLEDERVGVSKVLAAPAAVRSTVRCWRRACVPAVGAGALRAALDRVLAPDGVRSAGFNPRPPQLARKVCKAPGTSITTRFALMMEGDDAACSRPTRTIYCTGHSICARCSKRQIDFAALRDRSSSSFMSGPLMSAPDSRASFAATSSAVDALMASACVPQFLSRRWMIDGEAYWDGGYVGNPPLWPIISRVQLPRHRDRAGPTDPARGGTAERRRDHRELVSTRSCSTAR